MSDNLKHIEKDDDFEPQLKAAREKLVVVDFYADWCGHCKTMGAAFEELAPNYPQAIFLKVNVDDCTNTAISHKVKCLPAFFFFIWKVDQEHYCGGDKKKLDSKIKEHYKDVTDNHARQASLTSFIDLGKCDCLNECQGHSLKGALIGDGYLESKPGYKLLMTIGFTEKVNIDSLQIHAPSNLGPKTLKLYVNQAKIFDCGDAEGKEARQTLELTTEDLEGSNYIPLCSSQFKGVDELTIYVTDNQNSSNKTQITSLTFYGTQITYVTDVPDF